MFFNQRTFPDLMFNAIGLCVANADVRRIVPDFLEFKKFFGKAGMELFGVETYRENLTKLQGAVRAAAHGDGVFYKPNFSNKKNSFLSKTQDSHDSTPSVVKSVDNLFTPSEDKSGSEGQLVSPSQLSRHPTLTQSTSVCAGEHRQYLCGPRCGTSATSFSLTGA